MRILAIDTCSKIAAISYYVDGEVKSLYSFYTDTHSTTLLPCIDSMMESMNLKIDDIDIIAATVGPGSFTGVRIGVATAKGLAFAKDIPCIGISTLLGMAENLRGIKGIVVPVMDARRQMVYTAVFESDENGMLNRVMDDCQIGINELADFIKKYENIPVYFIGDGADFFNDEMILPAKKGHTPLSIRLQNAAGVAYAAEKTWEETEDKSCFTDIELNPVYLKKTQAEREREEALKNS